LEERCTSWEEEPCCSDEGEELAMLVWKRGIHNGPVKRKSYAARMKEKSWPCSFRREIYITVQLRGRAMLLG